MSFPQQPFTGAGAPAAGILPGAGRASFGQASTSAMSMKWSALHDASRIVASLGGLVPDTMTPELRNFPALARDAGGWRREMIDQGVDDLSVILEAGLAALLAVHGRGVDVRPAALSLWHEYQTARAALMEVLPAGEGPRRAF